MQIFYLNSDLCFSCSNLLKKAKTATIVANIQLLWKLFILQAMHNYQRTSTSMFIGHFALTPEPLVCLSWNFVLGSSILGAGRVRISAPCDQKNVGHPEESPLCKWSFAKERRSTEVAGSSRWSFATICAPLSLWFWSSREPSSLQMTICKKEWRSTEEAGSSEW